MEEARFSEYLTANTFIGSTRKILVTTFAPMVIGNFISLMLTGVLSILTFRYFSSQRGDHVGNKVAAFAVWGTSFVGTAFGSSRIIKLCILHSANEAYFLDLTNRHDDFFVGLMSHLSMVITQAFLAWKAISFTHAMKDTYGPKGRSLVWTTRVVLVLGVLVCWVMGLCVAIYFGTFKSYTEFVTTPGLRYRGEFAKLVGVQVSCYLVVDTMLTITLSFGFRHARTGFAASSAVLDSLITILLRSGLIITLCQCSQLILGKVGYVTWSNFTFMFIGKIYAMTVLSFLLRPKEIHRQWKERADAETSCQPARTETKRHDSTFKMGADTGISVRPVLSRLTPIRSRCHSCEFECGMNPSFPTAFASPLQQTPNIHTSDSPFSKKDDDAIESTHESKLLDFRAALQELEMDPHKRIRRAMEDDGLMDFHEMLRRSA